MSYIKFKTRNCKNVFIKQSRYIDGNAKNTRVMLKYKEEKSEIWKFYSPEKIFVNLVDVISYIIEHTETDGTKFKIISFGEK